MEVRVKLVLARGISFIVTGKGSSFAYTQNKLPKVVQDSNFTYTNSFISYSTHFHFLSPPQKAVADNITHFL